MGKNRKQSGSSLGRSIIKDRFKGKPKSSESFLHTSELADGYDWGRLNLRSVTDQNQLDEFLATAELAGTEFTAEKLNIKILSDDRKSALPSPAELARIKAKQDLHRALLRIPRRPEWNAGTTAEELDRMERMSFLDWRRELASLQDIEQLLITPYERNLEFWRQLWRVIEKSDIVVQIVDGRNPLLFHCKDLDKYVSEINSHKKTVVLVNKSDLLTDTQRQYWADHFTKEKTQVLFWSALQEQKKAEEELAAGKLADSRDSDDDVASASSEGDDDDDVEEEEDEDESAVNCDVDTAPERAKDVVAPTHAGDLAARHSSGKEGSSMSDEASVVASAATDSGAIPSSDVLINNPRLLTGEELVDVLKSIAPPVLGQAGLLVIGLVGYPNVGKSLTINALLHAKKVSVSATPGKTKHFQTLFLDPSLMLCDCPGLVMPSFVTTKSEMIVSGILPIDQMRDHLSPIDLVCQRIPKRTLEITYGICIPRPPEGDDPDRPPHAEELLNAYGCVRGYMTSGGMPDCSRTARLVLKNYVSGKLLYCHPPPSVSESEFKPTPTLVWKHDHLIDTTAAMEESSALGAHNSELDAAFFRTATHSIHSKGVKLPTAGASGRQLMPGEAVSAADFGSTQSVASKPWKKHGNRNKKEKVRRVFSHHDQYSAF